LKDVSLKSAGRGHHWPSQGLPDPEKAPFLNLIGALDRPSSGRILLQDADLSMMDEKLLAE